MELELRRDLADLCHLTGIRDWEPLLREIFDWIAEAQDDERLHRIDEVQKLYLKLKPMAARLLARSDAADAVQLRNEIYLRLKAFVEYVRSG